LYSHIEKQICEKILKGFNSPPLLNLGQTLILTIIILSLIKKTKKKPIKYHRKLDGPK